MSVTAAVRRVGDVSVIDFSGKITRGAATGIVRETIRDVVNSGGKQLLINLKEVTYIDSAGVGELGSAYVTLSKMDGAVKLLHPQSKVQDLLQITKLYAVLVAFDDEEAALRSFGQYGGDDSPASN
jgi:anti-sigma B factor antagonist